MVEVRQLGGNEILRALVAAEGNACAAFRLSHAVDGTGVEVVHAMFDGVVYLPVDHILVELLVIIRLCRQAHHAVAQQ